jgi:2-keto-4-pentenoate hydratase/2-oxohepta-3-ene-1,7-dioic acid hydratase in catechol pathway
MRLARFSHAGGQPSYGLVLDAAKAQPGEPGAADGTPERAREALIVAELSGHPISEGGAKLTGASYPLDEVRLLTPVVGSSKIVCVGRNYADHIEEMGNQRPAEPIIFLKPSTAVCGPGDPIRRPVAISERIDYEGELAVVIGRVSQDVPAERAAEVIFGYTCANDVTARDLQAKDGQWTRAKGFDTFCPLGPWVETDLDPADLALATTLNDEVRQQSRTSLLLHGVPALIAFVTQVMTLLPGDVLLTGTPAGVGPMAKGDEVAVTIEGIGTLANPVTDRD